MEQKQGDRTNGEAENSVSCPACPLATPLSYFLVDGHLEKAVRLQGNYLIKGSKQPMKHFKPIQAPGRKHTVLI